MGFDVTLLDIDDYTAWKAANFQNAGGITFDGIACESQLMCAWW